MNRRSIYVFPGSSCVPKIPAHKRLSTFGYEDYGHHGLMPSLEEVEPMSALEVLKRILKRTPKERQVKSLQFLVNFTSNIKFFQDLAKEQSDEAHFQCCQHMTYDFRYNSEVRLKQIVFHKGDLGSKFYIILEGSCGVLIPTVMANGEEELNEVMVYNKGDSFGELALLKNQPRAATIICKADTHFAVLDRDDFTRIIGKVKELLLNKKVQFLQSIPVFSNWTKGSMQKLSYYFKERTYHRKQVVFSIGDESTAIYFIREGEFQVLQNVASGSNTSRKGKNFTLAEVALLSKDQFFGEEDILEGQSRSYTCVCHSTSAEVLVISKEDFFKRINNEESLSYLREMHRQKLHFRQRRRDAISCVQEMRSRTIIPLVIESQMKPGASTASSPDSVTKELKRHVIGLKKPPRRSFELKILTERLSPVLSDLSPDKAQTTRAFPIPMEQAICDSPKKSATWDFILSRKNLKRVSSKPELKRVVNIHTNKLKAAQRKSLFPREASDFFKWANESPRRKLTSSTSKGEGTRPGSGLLLVRSLSEFQLLE